MRILIQKISFNTHKLVLNCLKTDYNKISSKECSYLIALLMMPREVISKLESSYNNQDSYSVLRFNVENSIGNYAICVKSSRKACLNNCAYYFSSHDDLKQMVIIYYKMKLQF